MLPIFVEIKIVSLGGACLRLVIIIPIIPIIIRLFINNGLNSIIPIGYIINELFSNSIKHGFPDGKGTITLNVYQKPTNRNINSNKRYLTK